MNSDQISPQPIPPSAWVPPIRARQRHVPNFASWVVGFIVLGTLLLTLFGGGSRVQVKGIQTKSLAQAKQIGLALRAYAADHGGNYPRAGLPAMLGAEVKDSNAAFAVLFPDYLTNESIFANRTIHGSRAPDNVFDSPYKGKPIHTLEPGENVYAYVAGLTEQSDEHAPLLADGTDGTGHYTTDPQKRGGVWGGKRAVVILLDNSGGVRDLVGPDHARYVSASDRAWKPGEGNLLDVAGLGPDVRLLDPAVGRRVQP